MEKDDRQSGANPKRFAIEFSIEEILEEKGGERAALCRWACTADVSPELTGSLLHLRKLIDEREGTGE